MNDLITWTNDSHDDRPLPEIIADGGDGWNVFPLAFIDDQERYYAVQDWIQGVAQTDNPRKFWNSMKKRTVAMMETVEMRTRFTTLPYIASNGRTYQMDFATAEGLYLITQRMSAETGIRNKVLAYLAKAGVQLDQMRIDPGLALDAGIAGYQHKGKDERWIEARTTGKISRQHFTEALRDALLNPEPKHYGQATNALYVGLCARTTKQLRAELGLAGKANLRDHFSQIALAYTSITEGIIAQELGTNHDLTWSQAEQIIKSVAALIRPQIEAVSQRLGVDVITDKPLLPGGGS